jgi:hypothetical protein
MNAIKTMYEGIEYKSRLEADIAWIINKIGYSHKYEPKSFLLPSGIHYMPDFYVPKIHLWIEGRGYQTEKGESQIKEFSRLISEGFIMPDGTLFNTPDFGREIMPFEEVNEKGAPDYLIIKYDDVQFVEYNNRFGCSYSNEGIALIRCSHCKKCCFIGTGSYQCRYCGAWYGNQHIDRMDFFNNIAELKEVVNKHA